MNVDELIEKRRLLGLNCEQMAERCGVSKNIIIDVENSKLSENAFPSTLRKLADGYGVSTEDIASLCVKSAPATADRSATSAA
jgi:transcriptional regulator with XRE-family HTH domain